MAKAQYIDDKNVAQAYVEIICPGCGHRHVLTIKSIDGQTRPMWGFNHDLNRPTFTPSLLCRWGKQAYSQEEWNKLDAEHQGWLEKNSGVCHSFIREGKIEFLGDCTHKLAGQTVELPDF